MKKIFLIILILSLYLKNTKNTQETDVSIVIEDVNEKKEETSVIENPKPPNESAEEIQRTAMLMEGLYCFSTLQQYLQANSSIISKIKPNGSHTKHSGKIITALFGHCKKKHSNLEREDQLKRISESMGNTSLLDNIFGDFDVDSIFNNPSINMNTEEKKLLYQFNEIAKEMEKRNPNKKPRSPEMNLAGLKVSEMSNIMVFLPIVLIIGFILLIWKTLFVKQEKKSKKKKDKKK